MRWSLKPKPDAQLVENLSRVLNVEKTIASLLVQRGIKTFDEAREFFRPSLDDLHDPYLMKDMDLAVKRLEKAIENNENILIFGDYDVDGTTSVALVSSFLLKFHPNIATYIPDRYEEGYGVSYQGIDFAHDNDISLIIALDCGIKAVDKVAYAAEKNIDFIICDHHLPGEEIPKAVAVLDPKREDCNYPYKELCGCGVGFKLLQAFIQNKGIGIDFLVPYLDLVATAIAADIVPINGENRILAYYGLQIINKRSRPGFKAIIENIKKEKLSVTDVVFIIAPRINAAGRMKHGNHAVSLLTETDYDQARLLAAEIEQYNTDRRNEDRRITEEALEQIRQNKEETRMTTVVYQTNWHKGVIGIVASRLTETYYRPTLVFTKSGDKLAASARSIKGFDVYTALESCAEHIQQFGGHKYAAGLTLLEEQYETFKSAFEKIVSETLEPRLLSPEISIDAEIDLQEITPRFYRILKQFGPFGPGNMSPVFMSSFLKESGYGRCVGEDGKHLRLRVTQENSPAFTAIGFDLGSKKDIACSGKPFKAAFCIEENYFQGNTELQLRLKDIRE